MRPGACLPRLPASTLVRQCFCPVTPGAASSAARISRAFPRRFISAFAPANRRPSRATPPLFADRWCVCARPMVWVQTRYGDAQRRRGSASASPLGVTQTGSGPHGQLFCISPGEPKPRGLTVLGASADAAGVEDPAHRVLRNWPLGVLPPFALARHCEVGVDVRGDSDALADCLDRVSPRCTSAGPRWAATWLSTDRISRLTRTVSGSCSKNGPEREKFSDPPVGPSLRREHSVGWRASEATRSTRSVCAITGLPLAWTVETARDAETTFALPLIDASNAGGFAVKTAIMDKVYDNEPIHTGAWIAGSFRSRHFARLPLSSVATASCPRASTGSGPSRAPTSSARLRSGDAPRASARPASLWVKTDRLHPPVPAHNGAESEAVLLARRGRARVSTGQA